jgi:limonene-1,2-epoxide hydrolase
MAKTQGEKPVVDKHFTPYGAYSTSIGSATYGYTNAVTILKKSTEIDVGAVNVKLIKVEALAKKVLPLF